MGFRICKDGVLYFWTANVTQRTATLFSLFMGKKMPIHRFVAQCSLISYHKNIVLFLTGQHWAADDIWELSTWHLPKPAPCSPASTGVPKADSSAVCWPPELAYVQIYLSFLTGHERTFMVHIVMSCMSLQLQKTA